jgi:hypothetical protein
MSEDTDITVTSRVKTRKGYWGIHRNDVTFFVYWLITIYKANKEQLGHGNLWGHWWQQR